MLGNVYEWCLDLYSTIKVTDWEYVENPTGATTGTERVQRGSSKGSASSITTTTRDKGEQTKQSVLHVLSVDIDSYSVVGCAGHEGRFICYKFSAKIQLILIMYLPIQRRTAPILR